MEKEGKTVEKSQKSTIIWDAQKKMPKKGVFIILIVITISILTYGIIDTLDNIHEIKITIEYNGDYYGEINIGDSYYSVSESDSGVHTYKVQEGKTVEVYVSRQDPLNDNLMTISIFDNGELVEQDTSSERWGSIYLEYTIEED